MLYANHASLNFWSPPTHSLRRLAVPVFIAQPARMIIIVKIGWQSSTTRDRYHDVSISTFKIL